MLIQMMKILLMKYYSYENAIQKGINDKDVIQLIKQHIIIKNKSKNIFLKRK